MRSETRPHPGGWRSRSEASTVGDARVTDSGPGVAADALAHLFEPFFSLKPHGTGLGLAIAKRTVEAHGGTIEGPMAAARPSGDAALGSAA
jgi:C4-dicarboxylate-specific signal transduction histidine kinase